MNIYKYYVYTFYIYIIYIFMPIAIHISIVYII